VRQLGKTTGDETGQTTRLSRGQVRRAHTGVPVPHADDDVAGLAVPGGSQRRPIAVGDVLPPLFWKTMNFSQSRLLFRV
jgi:hypothetical protein